MLILKNSLALNVLDNVLRNIFLREIDFIFVKCDLIYLQILADNNNKDINILQRLTIFIQT